MTQRHFWGSQFQKRTFIYVSICLLSIFIVNKMGYSNPMRVAILKSRSIGPYEDAINGFKKYYKDSDISIQIDQYDINGRLEMDSNLLKDIKSKNTQYIVTVGSEAYLSVRDKQVGLPIVISMVYSPVEEGLVDIQKEKNVYGVSLKVPFEKRLKLLKEMMPFIKKIAVIHHQDKKEPLVSKLTASAKRHHMNIHALPINTMKEFIPALKKAINKTDALLMILDKRIYNSGSAREMLMLSARNHYPIIAISQNYVKSGALMSISSSYESNGKQTAKLLHKIMQKKVSQKFHNTSEIDVSWNRNVSKAYGIKLAEEGEKYVREWF